MESDGGQAASACEQQEAAPRCCCQHSADCSTTDAGATPHVSAFDLIVETQPTSPEHLPQPPCQCLCGGAVLGDASQATAAQRVASVVVGAPLTSAAARTGDPRNATFDLPPPPGDSRYGMALRRLHCSLLC
ncbi:MAG: hypothetical protein RIC55_14335 [Pirellulaceae bacterium]